MQHFLSSFNPLVWKLYVSEAGLDTVKDFLIKLDMKSRMRLVEISIFFLNNVTVRLTNIMNNILEHLKILIFKVIFQCQKLVRPVFPKKIL